MSKPTHTAYVVNEPREGTEGKAMWREVGAVWPHKSGKGFDLNPHSPDRTAILRYRSSVLI